MFERKLYNWQKVSLFNLFLVCCVGLTLRYKILFPLPFVEQKFLLHAHSHFAFSGWVSQILMAFIVKYLYDRQPILKTRKYNWLLWLNLVSAYGMLLSFPFQGYGLFSIIFSTLSIFTGYAFAIVTWMDLNRLEKKDMGRPWLKVSLLCNALSSAGAFSLAFMMANKITDQKLYLEAIYFFLHFQYNGWFFFGCMGLFQGYLANRKIRLNGSTNKAIFWLFAAAVLPAYFLSALWLPIPGWLYAIVIASALSQLVGYGLLAKELLVVNKRLAVTTGRPGKWLWTLAAIALSIKLVLQLVSTIPALSELTVGFRPIVIGYLHLVLLGVISIFLIGYFVINNGLQEKRAINGVAVFVGGIIINEVLLMVQGISCLIYVTVPYINEMLFVATLIMFTGLFILNSALNLKPAPEPSGILT